MGQCVWCGSKGIFLSVDKNKLCSKCQSFIYFDIQQRLRIIEESQEIIKKTENFKTLLHRIETILEHIQALKAYEDKDISTVIPKPSDYEKVLLQQKEELINENIMQEIGKIMNKARLGLTAKSKINEANKAILLITERSNELKDREKIDNMSNKEKEIRNFIHDTQLNEFLEEAKKAEFKGQRARALDKYQEALYYLQTDKIDDIYQKDKIEEINAKILELSKKSGPGIA
jgi:hypothetical protein